MDTDHSTHVASPDHDLTGQDYYLTEVWGSPGPDYDMPYQAVTVEDSEGRTTTYRLTGDGNFYLPEGPCLCTGLILTPESESLLRCLAWALYSLHTGRTDEDEYPGEEESEVPAWVWTGRVRIMS